MDAHGVTAAGILTLPDDILEEILRHLRAHSLARCRCVCAPWRRLVDARGLLRAHALPRRAFPGFFANLREPWRNPGVNPGFLPPPASRAAAPVDRLAFLRPHLSGFGKEVVVQDQCNGLVLCFQQACEPLAGLVCNPTTQRWAPLPDPPARWPRRHDGAFLAFDPAVSLDYEAFVLPAPRSRGQRIREINSSIRGKVTLRMFMPESFLNQREEADAKLLPLMAFSSASGRWRRRMLAPGRCAPALLYDRVTRWRRMQADPWARAWRSAVYRRGTLYAHCDTRVLVVLRCAEGTYDMVEVPSGQADAHAADPMGSIFLSSGDGDGAAMRVAG